MARLRNPVVPGFNPDPSIVAVDGIYYLVTSTFEYLPGIPVYRSTDLETWVQVGNVITRGEQLDLATVPVPGGVWAPTIRHHAGMYYVIVTVMFEARCLVFTAADPAGPWSDGLHLPDVDGIDPDLAWDDDGTAYVTFARMGRGIVQLAVDLDNGLALEQPRPLWSGSGMHAPEGPHLYHRGDDWYLLIAEGGTERGHAVSVARGASVTGPFEGYTANPILTARSTAEAVQNVGHADLVETPDGHTFAVALGVRPVGFTRSFSPLGRETFLTPVDWVERWPHPRPILIESLAPSVPAPLELDLAAPETLDDPAWIGLRHQPHEIASVSALGLTIFGRGSSLSDLDVAFLGRRQHHHTAAFQTTIIPGTGIGGLAARQSDELWFAVEAEASGGAVRVRAVAALAGIRQTWEREFRGPQVTLAMEFSVLASYRPGDGLPPTGGDRIRLSASDGGDPVTLAELDGRYWSFETSESFTGRVIGLYATRGAVTFRAFTITE